MTTSISNASADSRTHADAAPSAGLPAPPPAPPAPPADAASAEGLAPRTVWGRFIILLLCAAVVTTTLAFGTVHAWSLAAFQLSAALVVALWMIDAWRTGRLRVSRSFLQVPLIGLAVLGLVQLLPLGGGAGDLGGAGLSVEPARALSFDPYTTRLVLIQLAALLVYFSAALAFIDSPRRLRIVVRTVVIFGFVLALFGLMQNFISPNVIYWVREPKQAQPFGPYINRHHFAGYMELALAMPLGLLFSGAVARDRVPLYGFAALICSVALVMTNSRGGIISMVAEIVFLVVIAAGVGRAGAGEGARDLKSRVAAAARRAAFAFALLAALFVFVLYSGGEQSLTRLVGTVNADDPTTGRTHFWKGAVEIIKDHPLLGVGLGAFGAAYPRYDTGAGAYRLEQAHNDYLQILTDGGVVGALLALAFVAVLFRQGFRRLQSHDKFRRGVALGALTGCAGALVHSAFDFTLHTTANALLFLLFAALATMNGRVEEAESPRRRRFRRRREGGGVQQPPIPLPRRDDLTTG